MGSDEKAVDLNEIGADCHDLSLGTGYEEQVL